MSTLLSSSSSSSTSSSTSSYPLNISPKTIANDKNNAYSFTSLVGALSGVKNIMNGLATIPPGNNPPSSLTPQSQKHLKSLTSIVDKFKLQTPETHLGLLLAYSDSLIAPITNSDLEFTWYRVDPQTKVPSLISNNGNPSNGWYAPCADDIGHYIRMQCSDTHNYGLIREFDSEIIHPGEELINKVEDAISKDRMTAKVIVSHVPENLHSLNTSQLTDLEIAGNIEVGSKGLLICEKGVDQSGLRFFSSPSIEVRCCQQSSFVLRFPISKDSNKSVINWVGREEGSLFFALENYLKKFEGDDIHLELLVSCRDRLVRDSLVMATRSLAAYIPSDPSDIDGSMRERFNILPWSEDDEKDAIDHPHKLFPSSHNPGIIECPLLELGQIREIAEKERSLKKGVKSPSMTRSFEDTGSPTSTFDTRSLSCNDLSLLSPSQYAMQRNSVLTIPIRDREESGYSCGSFIDDSPQQKSDESDLVAQLKNEISVLREKCEELENQNRQLRSECSQTKMEKPELMLSARPEYDSPIVTDLQALLSQAKAFFTENVIPDVQQCSATGDPDSELSGTDSSEHSHEQTDLVDSQKQMNKNLKNIIDSINEKFCNLVEKIPDNKEQTTVLIEKNQLLESRCRLLEESVESLKVNFNLQIQANLENCNQLSSSHLVKINEYEGSITTLQQSLEGYQLEIKKLSQINSELNSEILISKQNSNKLSHDLHEEIHKLTKYNTELMNELTNLKERYCYLEKRNYDLQQEILEVSDSKQNLIKQINASDTIRKQMNQMKSQMNSLNHELQGVNELLINKQQEYEKLMNSYEMIQSDLDFQKKLNEKSTNHLNEILERNENLENNLQTAENNRSSLMKENNRLRNTINQLTREKKKLDEMEPLYHQQLSVLANIHSRTSELETKLLRTEYHRNESILIIISYELRYGLLEKKYKELLHHYETISMTSEDIMGNHQQLQQQLENSEYKIKLLKQDLNLSKQAEPFVVKKLNYLLSKLHGEKNHYEQKAKSLSRDLQKRLLEGTPLQRELGRVTARLEELENERNAYRDAMVLVCDTYAGKDDNGSWFLY